MCFAISDSPVAWFTMGCLFLGLLGAFSPNRDSEIASYFLDRGSRCLFPVAYKKMGVFEIFNKINMGTS